MTRSLQILFSLAFLFATPFSAFAQPAGGNPTPVIVSQAERKSVVDEVEALGTLKANESVNLTSTVTETIIGVFFEDGQQVEKGTVLAEMDASEDLADLAAERSTLREAEQQIARIKSLTDRRAASKSEMDQWQRAAETSRARIQAIQSRIEKKKITAPFDGVVGLRNISVGALAQPGTLITTIDDNSVMKLDFSIPSVFLSTLSVGLQIEARTHAYPDNIFMGTIASIDSRIDPITRSVTARALIENPDRHLRPGLLMRVTLKKSPRQALVLPESALIPEGKKHYVYSVKEQDGKTTADYREIQIGTRFQGEVEILSGVTEGEKIITHGALRTRPGGAIKITAIDKGGQKLEELLQQAPASGAGVTP